MAPMSSELAEQMEGSEAFSPEYDIRTEKQNLFWQFKEIENELSFSMEERLCTVPQLSEVIEGEYFTKGLHVTPLWWDVGRDRSLIGAPVKVLMSMPMNELFDRIALPYNKAGLEYLALHNPGIVGAFSRKNINHDKEHSEAECHRSLIDTIGSGTLGDNFEVLDLKRVLDIARKGYWVVPFNGSVDGNMFSEDQEIMKMVEFAIKKGDEGYWRVTQIRDACLDLIRQKNKFNLLNKK